MAYVFKDGTLTLSNISGATSGDFSDVVTSAVYTPSSSTQTATAISGKTVSDSSLATWTLDLTFFQHDLSDPNSLPRLLHQHEGATATATYVAHNGADTLTSTVTLQAATVGSDGTSIATASVSLPSDKPDWS